MVHVITNGAARPNPGNAGWCAVIRQNGRCTFDFGQYAHATNNAVEIRAVVEASRVLPEGMHVWVSTDSAYVKKGFTEWLPEWIRNNWRNSKGAAVANKTLWQALLGMVGWMRKIEWSWMKAHSGILLNECADILATKGVANEQPPAPVQDLVPMGEDMGNQVYEIKEGEATQ
jgi:ribonuclease HI